MNKSYFQKRTGFLLLETLIGIALLAFGVFALARCVDRCLDAESAKAAGERARVALENRMAEIETGAVALDGRAKTEELGGRFRGITLIQTRTPLRLKDERGQELDGLFRYDLEARWGEMAAIQSKELTFYANAQNQ